MILIAYDGSPDAKAAVETAGRLCAGQHATVLTVWEYMTDVMARSSAGLGLPTGVDLSDMDARAERGADATAEEGAELARQAGLDAAPSTARAQGSIAGAILDQADALGADAVLLGTRGLRGLRSMLLGSVSHGVLQHADRPVMVIPSAEVAADRSEHRR